MSHVVAAFRRLLGLVVVEIEFTGAWAEITHHRYVLRRMAQQRVLELSPLEQAARRLRALGARVRSTELVGVSSAILAWGERAMQSEAREQAGPLLLELSGALDHLCAKQDGGPDRGALTPSRVSPVALLD